MRKMKRLIALVTVAMFLFAFAVAPAMAATKEDSFGRLKALSVAIGDATGNPQYDKAFTRAEAAAIMVNLLGMKAAIDAAKGNTKFKDVTASYWGSGVINLAVGSGVIKGYPDGTFKPDANVTYAEMSAMLVQVLGYGPKLTGTWPSNVIGKAAQLGLLDGVNVTDYNAAAIRANVFMAADNSLDVKPLTETKNGFEEDTKTLMEKKLNVTKLEEATVITTPAFGGADKGKATLDPTDAAHADIPIECATGVNPDDFFGLKVEAWEKDDKVFFFNVKTASSDIVVDTIKELRDGANALVANGVNAFNVTLVAGPIAKASDAGTTTVANIKLDKADKTVGIRNFGDAGTVTKWYKNYKILAAADGVTISCGSSVKVILGADGKADYVIATSTSTGLIDSVDTVNEKINFDSDASATGSITFKDKKYTITKNGAAATLADLKKGDVIDYIADAGSNSDIFVIKATDKTETAKITGVLDDGMNKDNTSELFKFQIGDNAVAGAKTIYVSTNNSDSFATKGASRTAVTSDFNNVLNKDVTIKYNTAGKISHIIAGSATSSSDIPVLVKYIKKVTSTDTDRYIYVAKFDGTQTYYKVTVDTKIDGIKVNESALKQGNALNAGEGDWTAANIDGPRLVPNSVTACPGALIAATNEILAGAVVKLNLNADGTVNEIKTYGSDLLGGTDYTVSKDNSTFQITAPTSYTTLSVGDTVKTLKVKTFVANVLNGAGGDNVADVNDVNGNGVIDDVSTVSLATLKSLDGAYANNAQAVKDGGKALLIALMDDNATQSIASSSFYGVVIGKGTNANGNSYATIGHDGKTEAIEGTTLAAKNEVLVYTLTTDGKISGTPGASTADDVYSGYTVYKVDSISDRQIKLIPSSASYVDVSGHDQYIIVDLAKTEAWDISDSNVAAAKMTSLNDTIGHYVNVYDVWDKDKNAATDGVHDYLMMIKK